MDSDLGEMVFAAEKISKKRLRKGKGVFIFFKNYLISKPGSKLNISI